MSRTGRNDPCPCSSGKKFKQCHGSPRGVPRPASTLRHSNPHSLHARNVELLDALRVIFRFNRGVTWQEVRRTLSADHVREVYRVIRWIWPPNTDLVSLLP